MTDPTFEAVETAMDQMINEFVAEEKFMGCVLVSKGDNTLLKKPYGFANLEWEIPNSVNTKFQIASVTKQFTAAAILLLQDRGKLNIDDLVMKHLPDSPACWDKITIFNLLTHTAGIYNYNDDDIDDYFKPMRKAACTPADVMELFVNKPLEFEPGEKIAYSNSGFVVLGRIIEKISGQSYAKFLQENIFEPLGMKDSGNDSRDEIIKRRASGYAVIDGELVNTDLFDIAVCFAGGSLYSSVEDLLKWQKGLVEGKVLSDDSFKKMISPFKENYAFGLTVTAENGRKVIKHKGKNPGFKSVLSYYPSDQLTIVVLSNNEHGAATFEIGRLAAAIARDERITLPSQRKAIELPSETLIKYMGEYNLERDDKILAIIPLGETLMAWTKNPQEKSSPVQDTYWLAAESDCLFFSRDRPGIEIEFLKNEKDEVSHLVLHQGNKTLKAERH